MDSKLNPSSDGLPSYSESVRSPQQQFSPGYSSQNIVAARTALVSSLLTTYVTPHLYKSAISGVSCTSLILVPSNVSSLHPPGNLGSKCPSETIVGFPSAENLTVVRLDGQENSLEFLRQFAVLLELELQIRTHLRSSGYRVIEGQRTNLSEPSSSNADWRTVQKETLGIGEVSVRVEIRDISMRTENDMGLYETRTGRTVVVKVHVGG